MFIYIYIFLDSFEICAILSLDRSYKEERESCTFANIFVPNKYSIRLCVMSKSGKLGGGALDHS